MPNNQALRGLTIFIHWLGFLLILPINIILAIYDELVQFITYPYRVNRRIERIQKAMDNHRDKRK